MAELKYQQDSVSVIIRSAGERTEQLCINLVLEQGIPEENIRLIKEVPFTRALQVSYQAGISLNRPWTLCLDADVLLLPDSIQDMITFAYQQEASLFEIQFLVIDKFIGGPREAGNHLYRTSLLEKALQFIPQDENVIRPESHILRSMSALGFSYRRVDYLAGIHDFEQYYRDIFRKCFIQAHKHQEYAEIYLSYWPLQTASDPDFKVAIKGLTEGIQYNGDVRIDVNQEVYQQRYPNLQISEKQELSPNSVKSRDIQTLVEGWHTPEIYQKYFHYDLVSPGQKANNLRILFSRFNQKKQELGLLKLPFFLVGSIFEKLGIKIKQLINPGNDCAGH